MSDAAENVKKSVTSLGDPGNQRLLADGCLGGILGAYLLLFYPVLQHPNPYNFLFIPYLPVALLVGAIMGTLTGGVLWCSEQLFKRNLGVLLRVLIGAAAFSIAFVLLNAAVEGTLDGRYLAASFL